MVKNPSMLIGGVVLGGVILGCGGGGTTLSGTTDYIYYIDNGTNIVRQDYPTGNPFTVGSGTTMSQIRISPDKSQMLFTNGGTLYLFNSNGTGLTTLTGYKSGDWNSDGTKVFAVSTDNKVRSMNPDGSGVSADLFDGNAGGGILSIDLNDAGTKIGIVWSPTGWSRIYTMNLDGSAQFAVTANNIESANARWSPDGTSFVFQRGGDIYTIEADGTGESALANTGVTEEMPSFRDNSTILYISDGDVWRMAADGTGETEVFDGTNALSWPVSKG